MGAQGFLRPEQSGAVLLYLHSVLFDVVSKMYTGTKINKNTALLQISGETLGAYPRHYGSIILRTGVIMST